MFELIPLAAIFAGVAVVYIIFDGGRGRRRAEGDGERVEKLVTETTERLARLEERMANIETLILDKERQKPFEELEKES